MSRRPKKPERHPALVHMHAAARGYLTSFVTDLTTHDERTLAQVPHGCAFTWILRPSGTHLAICQGYTADLAHPFVRRIEGREIVTARGYAAMVVRAFGADDCRFYFWNGCQLIEERCAADLDEHAAEWEESQRELYQMECDARAEAMSS